MGMSRSSRILTLLAIDTVFFFLEIIVGYTVHSLALVADSFHMLNDVFSLLVALWAIKLAKAKSTSDYTYGWQRAEVLGALVNGVFLLALCLSIFLEAIQRLFEPQIIKNPWLILGVGSAGLASNIVGLFLFHEHGLGHGHDHGHGPNGEGAAGLRQVHDEGDEDIEEELLRDEGDIESVLPDTVVRHMAENKPAQFAHPETHIHVHPAMNRAEVVNAAESEASDSAVSDDEDETEQDERTPLFNDSGNKGHGRRRADSRSWHHGHHHSKPRKQKSTQNLNMRGVFLHVLGDALGNVGVMLTALFVQYAPRSPVLRPFTNYADPCISLIITIIIFSSAMPLVKSASKILLQGVPKGISLEEVKQDIASIPGVISVHELHIWQLSDVKLIASLHIQIGFDPESDRGVKYMRLAKAVRTCLHAFGVHSVTIQPEFTPGRVEEGYGTVPPAEGEACLLECGDECETGKCCGLVDPSMVGQSSHGHAH